MGRLFSVPQNVSRLAAKPNVSEESADIEVLWHEPTQHVRITNFQPQEYYSDYFMTTSFSSSMQDLQDAQARRLFEFLPKGTKSHKLIEIGCGDGSFLNHAAKYFDKVVGVEPSVLFQNAVKLAGHEVLDGYVLKGQLLTSERFNAFASRQVFEHLPDPLDTLQGIREMLLPGAVGLIEVPNGYRAFRLGRFFEFFPDHVNYYSATSLVSLARSAGFMVLSCGESFNGDYLELWVANEKHQSDFVAQLEWHRSQAQNSIEKWWELARNSGAAAFFGCGAKALTIAATNPQKFQEVFSYGIDSDPNKNGRFVPNTSIEILSISDLRLNQVSSVFITALSYQDEIARTIRETLPRVGLIGSLGSSGELMHL